MKSLLLAIVAFAALSNSAYSFCTDDALKAAKTEAAKMLDLPANLLSTELLEESFSETYGRGSYIIDVSSEYSTITFSVDMIAYTDQYDAPVACEVNEIYSL